MAQLDSNKVTKSYNQHFKWCTCCQSGLNPKSADPNLWSRELEPRFGAQVLKCWLDLFSCPELMVESPRSEKIVPIRLWLDTFSESSNLLYSTLTHTYRGERAIKPVLLSNLRPNSLRPNWNGSKKFHRSFIRTQALEITKQVSLVSVYRSVGHKGVELTHK